MYRDYDDERDDELYHYGKTGMKWGHNIRKKTRKLEESYKQAGGSSR